MRVARAGLHHFEEPCISGERGSGTVFFSGCNLKCVFCQNYELSAENFGKEISTSRLAEIFSELEAKGAENINLVNPTHYVPQIVEALDIYRPKIPVVYNSSGYESLDSLKLVSPYVDVFLPDYKYAQSEVAERYSQAKDYPEVALSAVKYMIDCAGEPQFNARGIMTRGVIVRHLVLPSHTDNSVLALERLRSLQGKFYLSLMSQYVPMGRAECFPEINRKITPLEYKRVVRYAEALGFTEGYTQELDSASPTYTPRFDLEGV